MAFKEWGNASKWRLYRGPLATLYGSEGTAIKDDTRPVVTEMKVAS